MAMRNCPACGATKATDIPAFSRGEWRIGKCDACGFVYLRNPPRYDQLVDEFAWEKTKAEHRSRLQKERPVLMAIDRALAFRWKFRRDVGSSYLRIFGQGKVLDVGCGRGLALPEPLIPFGIELSAARHAEADANMKKRGGYALFGPAIERLQDFPEGSFDGVLMSSILEHEQHPRALLEGVRRVLSKTGKLYLRLPNYGSSNRKVMGARWGGFRYPDHVNYFTVPQMKRMAEETGYRFRQLNRFSPFSDNMHILLTPRT